MPLNPLQRRRLANFKANRRAFWSLWIFLALFLVTLCAEFVANDRPLLVRFQGEFYLPVLNFYSEADFGGEFQTEAEYTSPEVRCLIRTGGLEACLDDPEGLYQEAVTSGTADGQPIAQPGWAIWPPIPYSFNTINYGVDHRPLAARPRPLARHRRPDPRRRRPRHLRLPHLGALRAGGRRHLQPDRHRRRRLPGLFRRLGRPVLPAHRRDSG